jgi:hypothetical protein
VQVGLDRHRELLLPSSTGQVGPGRGDADDDEQPLKVVEDIVGQAILLARQSHQSRLQSGGNGGRETEGTSKLYPAEELEWLSTTVFNLGIDFYVSRNSTDGQNLGNASVTEAEARKWSHLAVEIADVLAAYERSEGGDNGLLVRLLRGKMRHELGWEI